jgi:hypothetical protein
LHPFTEPEQGRSIDFTPSSGPLNIPNFPESLGEPWEIQDWKEVRFRIVIVRVLLEIH